MGEPTPIIAITVLLSVLVGKLRRGRNSVLLPDLAGERKDRLVSGIGQFIRGKQDQNTHLR